MRFYPENFFYQSFNRNSIGKVVCQGAWLGDIFTFHYEDKFNWRVGDEDPPSLWLKFSRPLGGRFGEEWYCEDIVIHWNNEEEARIANFIGIDDSIIPSPLSDAEFKNIYEGFKMVGELLEDNVDDDVIDFMNELEIVEEF